LNVEVQSLYRRRDTVKARRTFLVDDRQTADPVLASRAELAGLNRTAVDRGPLALIDRNLEAT